MLALEPSRSVGLAVDAYAARIWVETAAAHEFAQRSRQAELHALVEDIALLDLAAEAVDDRLDHAVHEVFGHACA